MGINVGAWGGALVTGFLADHYGWHIGFLAAAIGMTIALIQYVVAGRSWVTSVAPPTGRSTSTGAASSCGGSRSSASWGCSRSGWPRCCCRPPPTAL
jgi:POT family proton-dependent oligopeptide transporter